MLNSFFDKFIFTSTIKYTHSNFYLVNVPFLILPVDALLGIAAVQDNEFQRKIYSAVKKSTLDNLMKDFGETLGIDSKKEVDFVETFFTASGWGQIQNIDVQAESKRAIVVLDSSPFVAQLRGKTQISADVFLRGVLAGLFSKSFKEDVDCVEVECAALTGERCKFIIKPKTEFDFMNKVVQEQLTHE